jgi:HEAT repeat protein
MLWWTMRQLKSSRWQLRADAAARLGAARERKAVPALIRAANDASGVVRLAAVNALAALRHPASAEPLAGLLAGLALRPKESKTEAAPLSESAEYEALAQALGALEAAAVSPLLRLLDAEKRDTRRWAARALGLARDPRAVEPLIRRLADNRSEVRKAAAQALGEIGDARALDPLVQCLSNRDHELRRAAAIALGGIGSARAVDALRAVAEDPNEPVQLAAVEALRRIGGLRAGAGLRAIADSSRKSLRDAALASLNGLKFDPATSVERAAAAILTGDFAGAVEEGESALSPLAETLGSRDANRRRQAVDALGLLRLPGAIQPLLSAMKDHDPAVQQAAAAALAQCGRAAFPGLDGLLAHQDPTVQCLAARALGDMGEPGAAEVLANAIEQNCVLSNEFPEAVDVARTAAAALARILAASAAASMPLEVLRRISEIPDTLHRMDSVAAQKPAVDCAQIRDLARKELQRRG